MAYRLREPSDSFGSMPFIEPADMLRSMLLRGWAGAFFHSKRMTFGLWDVAADAEALHEHKAQGMRARTRWIVVAVVLRG